MIFGRLNESPFALFRAGVLGLCLIGAGFASLEPAHAQAQPEPRNIVQLSSSGTVEAQQDLLTLTLSASRDGTDAASVQSYLRRATDTALTQIKKSLNGSAQNSGVEVRTGSFSLRPRYGNDGRISGWTGSTELVLEGADFARISAAAALATPLTISNLTFGLSRDARAKLENQARKLAIESFRSKAADIAKEFGFQNYVLREVAINTNDHSPAPLPRMMAMSADAKSSEASMVPLESGKTLVIVTVSGGVQLQ